MENVSTVGSERGLVDMNNDKLDDLVSIQQTSINIHYQLEGGGFNPVSIGTSWADNTPSWSLAAGDFDGNGYNDLLYGGGSGVTFMQANSGGTSYTEISGGEYVFSQRSNFVDINNDGHLDAFVCHDIEATVYYINDGNGVLEFFQGPDENGITSGVGGVGYELASWETNDQEGGNYASVWIEYVNTSDRDNPLSTRYSGSEYVVSEYSNAQYDFMVYSHINDVGKQWIRKYTLALAKELLGIVRSKYGTIPIPNAEVSLDGDTLRAEATAEKEQLREQLRENLEQTSRKALMEAQRDESESQQETLRKVPYPVYIG